MAKLYTCLMLIMYTITDCESFFVPACVNKYVPFPNRINSVGTAIHQISGENDDFYDVVVIGSGIGGLSCSAMLATKGLSVAVCESHYEIGGCAHEFIFGEDGVSIPSTNVKNVESVYRFEAGPSLYAGLSPLNSPNPLKHVFQMVGEEPEWITYKTWGAFLPEIPDGCQLSIGEKPFRELLKTYGGVTALADWEKLSTELRPLAQAVMGLPTAAIRFDIGMVNMIPQLPNILFCLPSLIHLRSIPFFTVL